jgi:50S ribosomal protein L16 3-hydroxylase
VDGECFECRREVSAFAEMLCAQDHHVIGHEIAKSDEALALLVQLFNNGSVTFDLAG